MVKTLLCLPGIKFDKTDIIAFSLGVTLGTNFIILKKQTWMYAYKGVFFSSHFDKQT